MGLGFSRPLIVLTNDDGVHSPGLVALKKALEPLGDVRIVAPEENRSGAARSITMRSPLWVEEVQLADGSLAFATDGTPVDCVRMAALGLLDRPPDLIVSGINLGGNLGDDITYSGTVAAAFEGIMLGIPAIALSAEGYHPGYDLSVPARFAARLISVVLAHGFPAKTALNVNCPDLPWEAIRGVRFTTLGKRVYGDKVEYRESRGKRHGYHIYNDELGYLPEPGTDFEAIAQGYISVTPLHFDLMCHEALEQLRAWEVLLAPVESENESFYTQREPGPLPEARASSRLPYQAVVFDLDGTVVDSVELIVTSFQHALREVLGKEVSREEAVSWVGRPLREQMELFSPEHADELVRAYQEYNHREHDRMVKLYDGITHLLEDLRRHGAKIGLVTSKSRHTTEMAFSLTGIGEYFDATVCAYESPGNKPSPDPIIACLGQLGVEPAQAVYVGDSPADIQAARAAGVRCLAVTWGVFSEAVLAAENPDKVVHTIVELREALGV